MNLAAPITETARGFRTFLRGLGWLRQNPKYLALSFVPVAIGFLFAVGGVSSFVTYDDDLLARIMFAKPESWYGVAAYWVSYWFLWVSSIALVLLSALLLINVVASPFYEIVSTAVEKDLTGKAGAELQFADHMKVMLVEIKKVVCILLISFVLLFIPVVNLIATFIAAFLVGWDFFDFPAARHGWSFGERVRFVIKEFWSVMGLGFWLIIPFVQIFVMPLAVAGGTILSLEAMAKRGQVTLKRASEGETLHAAIDRS